MYTIHGGIWTDMGFTQIIPGTEERYGPFSSYDEAVKIWRGRMGRLIDTCEHRLFILKIGEERAEPPSYHDLFITTAEIERTSIMNLPYRVQVTCSRAAGWQVWAHEERDLLEERLGGEYGHRKLRLDVAGVVICDSLTTEPARAG